MSDCTCYSLHESTNGVCPLNLLPHVRVRPCFGEDVLVLEVTSKDLGRAWQKLFDEQDARMLLSAYVTVNDDDEYVVTGYLHR